MTGSDTTFDAQYQALIADDHRTSSRPTQWEGHLADGRPFAFTYRQGRAWLTINPGTPDNQTVSRTYDGDKASELGDSEYRALFLRLVARVTAEVSR